MYAQDSIDLLQNSGLQFKKHEEDGIEPVNFAELLMTSGIVLFDNIKMLSFHRFLNYIFVFLYPWNTLYLTDLIFITKHSLN